MERGQLAGQRFELFVAEADRTVFAAYLQQAFERRANMTCEVALQTAGDQVRYARLEATVSGDTQTCRMAVMDITERKQANAALAKLNAQLDQRVRERTAQLENETAERRQAQVALQLSEERYRSLVTATAQMVWTTDAQGAVVDDLPTWRAYTGQTEPEIKGQGWASAVHPDDRARTLTVWAQAMDTRELLDTEFRVRRWDGVYRHFAVRGIPILEKDGALREWVGTCTDITERDQAEAVLRRNAERARTLSDVSQALAAVTLDYQFVLDTIVRRSAELFGDVCLIRVVSDDGQWLKPVAWQHPDPRILERAGARLRPVANQSQSLAGRVAQTGQPLLTPVVAPESSPASENDELPLTDDDLRVHSLLIVSLRAQGRVIGTLSLVRLIPDCPLSAEDQATAQSLADRAALAISNARLFSDLATALAQEKATQARLVQAEKFAAMGRLLATVAHELNSPLQTIRYCLYLTEGATPAEAAVHQYVEMAKSEVQRLMDLVTQLRDASRPRPQSPRALLDPCDVVTEALALVAPQLQSLRVTWQFSLGPDHAEVEGVADQLKQVFMNLSLNAAQAMQPDGGTLSVETVVDSATRQVAVVFHDTGPGISPEAMGQLFEPFFTTKNSGMGLGLTICHNIVEQHGGTISVDSPLGEGTTFTVWLPVAHHPSADTSEAPLQPRAL